MVFLDAYTAVSTALLIANLAASAALHARLTRAHIHRSHDIQQLRNTNARLARRIRRVEQCLR